MSERIFIGVAWPYANGPLHLGHVAGAYLPADIFARYHRIKGNEVLMVSGSDQHGTPITVRAEKEGKTPAEVAEFYHKQFKECWQGLGIGFDLFTSTGTANHAAVVQDFFLKLLNKGDIYKGTMSLPYCPKEQRFLPDRYVEGTCPFCGYLSARGDQCDQCGKPLNAIELVNPRCLHCKTTPITRESEHFFLKLSAFQDRLMEWVKPQKHWRSNAYNFTLNLLQEGLHDRAITRDIQWGIPIPVPGFEDKRIYVWFDAVIGYLSGSMEWSKERGTPEKWRDFWQKESKSYYFIGKDNTAFHTIIWPSMLMGYGGLNLPYDIPANEFLNIEAKKLSTSRNWAVWVPDYLSRYDPDPLRYLMSINMPESSDSDFSWEEFLRRNNDELVATYGNLAHRVLTFTHKNFEQSVPLPGELDAASSELVAKAKAAVEAVDKQLHACHFREAIRSSFALAQEANRYLDAKAPWKMIKQDWAAAGTSLYVALNVISTLRVLLYPFLPFSSQKLHGMLGYEGDVKAAGWAYRELPPGQKLGQPQALFAKLDDSIVAEETARLGK